MADEKPQTAAQWVTQHSQHKKNIRLVLMELAGFIDAGNDCPSQKELADKTGLSKDTIRRCLAELQKDGTVAIVKNGGGKVKGGHKDCYRLPKYTHAASSTQLVAPNYQHIASSTVQPVKHEQPESSTGEYVHTDSDTAGANNALSVSPEKKKDRQTDSVTPDELKQERESVRQEILSEAQKAKKAFEENIGVLTGDMLAELTGQVTLYGLEPVMVAIANGAAKQRKEGLRDPMMYIRQALAGMALEGKVPKLSGSKPGSHRPASVDPALVPVKERATLPREEWVDLAQVMADAPKRGIHA